MAIDWMTKSYDPSTGQTILLRNKVDHLVQDGTYRCSLAYGNTFAWAELYGTYTTGTLPTGVASLTCTRTSRDPAISTGTLSEGEPLYRYDTLTYTAGASSYFDLSIANPTVTLTPIGGDMTQLYTPAVSPRTREKTLDGVTSSGVSATGQMFTLKASNFDITGDKITISYYDKDGNEQTYTETKTASAVPYIVNFGIQCWRGGLVSWSVTSGSNYWSGNSGTITVGYQAQGSTRTISAKTRKTRAIRFYKVTGVTSYSVTYTNSSGTRTTTTVTPTSTYSTITAFIGATVTWTATATAGYTVSPSSGTISTSASTTAVTVQPTATAISKGWYTHPEFTSTISASWTATQWDSTTYSNTNNLVVYNYLRVHTSGIRVSGTLTVGSTTASFSNVEVPMDTTTSITFTDVVTLEYNARYWLTLELQLLNNTLKARVENTGMSKAERAFSVTITDIQVYTYPASVTLSAPVNQGYDSDSYCFTVENTNSVSVSCLYNGTATWGSSDELDTGGEWEYHGPTISANSSYDVGSSDVIGTSEDESVAEMNLEMAFVADDYLNMSPSTTFEV